MAGADLAKLQAIAKGMMEQIPLDTLAMMYANLVNAPTFPQHFEEKNLAHSMYQELLRRAGPYNAIQAYERACSVLKMIDPNAELKTHYPYHLGWKLNVPTKK